MTKKKPKTTELQPEHWPIWAEGLDEFAQKSGKSIRHLFGQSIHDLYVSRMGKEPKDPKTPSKSH